MAHIVNTLYDGLASLTAVRELTKVLIKKGLLTKEEGLGVFLKSAELHDEANTPIASEGNKDAAQALRECHEEMCADLES